LQGSGLRNLRRSPEVPKHEIQGSAFFQSSKAKVSGLGHTDASRAQPGVGYKVMVHVCSA